MGGGVGDANVVDLRDKKGPLVVDPQAVKGPPSEARFQPTSPPAAAPSGVVPPPAVDNIPFFFHWEAKQGVFPKNPEAPLINPLRDPEKWKAYDETAKASLNARIRKNRADEVIRRLQQDPGLNEARDRIVRDEEKTILRMTEQYRSEAHVAVEKVERKHGVDYVFETGQNNPEFQREADAIVADYFKKVDEAAAAARRHSLEEMEKEVEKAQDRMRFRQ
jgi:hypothetical protein